MEKDILNYSPTVMFRGTPCISGNIETTKKADQVNFGNAKTKGILGLLTLEFYYKNFVLE